MAPMQTVREAVTKASTNPLSFALPVLIFSHWPNRSKAPSRSRSSPAREPRARQPMISMVPPLTTPVPSTVSIPSSAPAMPRNNVHTPQVLHRASWTLSLKKRPKTMPRMPPARIARVLMMVPSPAMVNRSLPAKNVGTIIPSPQEKSRYALRKQSVPKVQSPEPMPK